MLKFRFDDVLFALDMTAPALRRWMQFDLIKETAKGARAKGGVLAFTCHDIAVLALVKPMTEFGVPVASAHKIAVRAMREHAGPWSGNEPPSAYWTAWPLTTQLTITRKLTEAGKVAWGLVVWEDADGGEWTSPVHLALNPQPIIRVAIERAIESAEAYAERWRA